ncbi:MAG: hypothetical protein IKC47_00800 [Clostridia bacterium]|nr:hypothetical protein [Clostridia bacterium]
MTKLKTNLLPLLIACLFVAVEIALGIYVQIGVYHVPVVSYCSVVLAFVFVLCCFYKSRLWLFTACAMATTLAADVFLVLTEPRKQLLAMIFFSCTQVFYALRLFDRQSNKKSKSIHLIVRIAASAAAVIATFAVLKQQTNLLSVISIIYYANLLCNVAYAFVTRDFVFAVGLICFALCDAFVGLSVLRQDYSLNSTLLQSRQLNLGFDPVWAFYVPSQTLIALSTLVHKRKN